MNNTELYLKTLNKMNENKFDHISELVIKSLAPNAFSLTNLCERGLLNLLKVKPNHLK